MARKSRRKRRVPRTVVVALGIVIFLLQRFGIWDRIQNQIDAVVPTQTVTADEGSWRVVRVVDGDTLVLQNDDRVRLIGVDTPETKHPTKPIEPFGPEASSFTKRSVEGKVVQLKFDREKRDRYQRLLAYVYLDDWCLNEEIHSSWLQQVHHALPVRPIHESSLQACRRRSKNFSPRSLGANSGTSSQRATISQKPPFRTVGHVKHSTGVSYVLSEFFQTGSV